MIRVLENIRLIVNSVWRPLRGPLYDWPLAVCDASTVDTTNDFTSHDVVYSTKARENIMVFHNEKQKWYYLSGQKPSELLLFRQADTEGRPGTISDLCWKRLTGANTLSQGVPHAAFQLPTEDQSSPPLLRESIEVRAVVCFSD